MSALKKNHTWSLVSFLENLSLVGCIWVFKIKKNSDGTIQKYKAKLVAKGFHQNLGIDFKRLLAQLWKHLL